MKNLQRIILLLAFTSAIASCNKEYNCECKTTDKSSGLTTSQGSHPISSTKKADAVDKCNADDKDSASFKTDCELQ